LVQALDITALSAPLKGVELLGVDESQRAFGNRRQDGSIEDPDG
jgi:hypothetical protein